MTKPRFPTGMNEDGVPFTEKKRIQEEEKGLFQHVELEKPIAHQTSRREEDKLVWNSEKQAR